MNKHMYCVTVSFKTEILHPTGDLLKREGKQLKIFRPNESLGRGTLHPAEPLPGCAVCFLFAALCAVTNAGVGFGDAAVFALFLLL